MRQPAFLCFCEATPLDAAACVSLLLLTRAFLLTSSHQKNWLGIPKEGVGSSRGAKGGPFGGPKFDDAKVTIECDQSLMLTVDLWAI